MIGNGFSISSENKCSEKIFRTKFMTKCNKRVRKCVNSPEAKCSLNLHDDTYICDTLYNNIFTNNINKNVCENIFNGKCENNEAFTVGGTEGFTVGGNEVKSECQLIENFPYDNYREQNKIQLEQDLKTTCERIGKANSKKTRYGKFDSDTYLNKNERELCLSLRQDGRDRTCQVYTEIHNKDGLVRTKIDKYNDDAFELYENDIITLRGMCDDRCTNIIEQNKNKCKDKPNLNRLKKDCKEDCYKSIINTIDTNFIYKDSNLQNKYNCLNKSNMTLNENRFQILFTEDFGQNKLDKSTHNQTLLIPILSWNSNISSKYRLTIPYSLLKTLLHNWEQYYILNFKIDNKHNNILKYIDAINIKITDYKYPSKELSDIYKENARSQHIYISSPDITRRDLENINDESQTKLDEKNAIKINKTTIKDEFNLTLRLFQDPNREENMPVEVNQKILDDYLSNENNIYIKDEMGSLIIDFELWIDYNEELNK
jgi:hypothetical protein